MKQVTISKSIINGTLTAPPSKSIFQRACAASILKQGATVLKNGGYSDDDKTAIAIIKQLGAQVVFVGTTAIIKFENKNVNIADTLTLNCNDSGLSSRMFMPVASSICYTSIIEGSDSLKKRPFKHIIEALRAIGLQVFSENNTLPIKIVGNLIPQNVDIDGSISSQFLTGMLLAYSSFTLEEPVTITVNNLVSKPYIDLTLQVIEDFGLNVPEHEDYRSFTFHPKKITFGEQLKLEIEGDWSAAITLLIAGAITENITVDGIDAYTRQGDKAALSALMDAGIALSITPHNITATHQTLKAFHYNATHTPDMFPVLAALATQCEGISIIEGVERLIHKESNRADAIIDTLTQLGVEAKIQDNFLSIKGKATIRGGITLQTHNDHRIAMMITLLGMVAEEPIVLEDAYVISKSFPSFYEDLIKIGANIKQE